MVNVKACAGINFMVLSFLGWCWLARPRAPAPAGSAPLEWPALLAGALVLAWMTALVANLLRIVAIVHLQPALQAWLPAGQAHRAVGMAVFLPALGLQWLLCEPQRPGLALLAAGGAYALLLLGVPLLSGHAAQDPQGYRVHALALLVALLPLVAAGGGWWWARRAAFRAGRCR
ncbi:MAG: hypothetical protein U1F30_01150 [Steroidobacteraceae bacterium]